MQSDQVTSCLRLLSQEEMISIVQFQEEAHPESIREVTEQQEGEVVMTPLSFSCPLVPSCLTVLQVLAVCCMTEPMIRRGSGLKPQG